MFSTPPAMTMSWNPAMTRDGGHGDGLETGGAEPVDGDGGDRIGQAGVEPDHPRDVHPLLGLGHGAAHDEVADLFTS